MDNSESKIILSGFPPCTRSTISFKTIVRQEHFYSQIEFHVSNASEILGYPGLPNLLSNI